MKKRLIAIVVSVFAAMLLWSGAQISSQAGNGNDWERHHVMKAGGGNDWERAPVTNSSRGNDWE